MNNKYVIRIYDVGTQEPPYVNYGEDQEDCKPIVIKFSNSKRELLDQWEKLLKDYEGWGYTVYDMEKNHCIVGGTFDPSDNDIIEDNIN